MAFEAFPAVEAVYLFGSHAASRARPMSDIDLGVVGHFEEPARQKLDMLTACVRHGIDDVDLVLLDRADPVTRYEAVRPNVVLYQTEAFNRGRYYSAVVRRYLDVQPLLKRHRQAYKQSLQA